MKKIVRLKILIASALLVMMLANHSHSQTKWGVPFIYSIHIPSRIEVYNFDNRPTFMTDVRKTIDDAVDEFGSLGADHIHSYIQNGDTININFVIQTGFSSLVNNEVNLHFVVDSSQSVLRDFLVSYHYYYYASHSTNELQYAIGFRALSYRSEIDSSVTVLNSGAFTQSNLDSISYSYSTYQSYGQSGSTVEASISSRKFVSVLADTAGYECRLTLFTPAPKAEVAFRLDQQNTFGIIASCTDQKMHFTIPCANLLQEIAIYDILGREVSRIEIPAGSSSCQMSSVGYPKGTYFARLGLQTASFIVN